MAVVFKNNAKTTLASGLTSSATSVTVADGSAFPSLSGGDTFFCTFDNGTNVEVVKVTARSSNTLTIVRAQDDTTARAFSNGDVAELRLTAGILNLFSQTGVAITDEIEAYLDANGTTFPDNVKAQFGSSNDLQIYHSGTNSIISEQGTGVLEVRTNGTEIQLTGNSGTDYMARFVSNGKTQLHYDGSAKLDTTSTGIDVTGAITSSGNLHAGDGTNISMDSSANGQLEVDGNGYQGAIALDGSAMHIYQNSSSRSLILGTNETARLTISGTGGFNFESNPVQGITTLSSGAITSTGTVTATGGNSTNWNTAYGWGNHASQSYITNSTASLDANKITSGVLNAARIPSPVSGDWWNGGVVKVGTDGVMEVGKYLDFHTADSGGNVDYDLRVTASAGALTVGGTIAATGGNSTNWNTAYGWGNHASAGYLTSSSTQSKYLRSDTADTATGKITFNAGIDGQAIFLSGATNFDALKQIGFYSLYNANASGHTNAPFQYGAMISSNSNASGGMGMQFAHERLGAGTYIRGMNDSGDTWYPWLEVWTSGTDGSGSGLDADLLDGQHGSYYLAYGNLTGTPTIPSLSGYATESYVGTQISNLVDSSPAALNTLNELAAAIGDDANFSTTVTNNIATKLPLAGGTMTGGLAITTTGNAIAISGTSPQILFNDTSGEDDFYIHVNSNRFYVLVDRDESGNYETPHPLELNASNNLGYAFGHRLFTEAYHPNADTLTTARTINGVSFNGSANITVADSTKLPLAGGTLTGTLNVSATTNARDVKISAGYHLQRSDHHSGHLEGSYNNIGANGTKSNPIYIIGSSYNPTDAALGNMYGIGYTSTASSFANPQTGSYNWGMYVAADGDARVWLDGSTGSIWSTNQHYVGANVVWNAGNDGAGSGLDADTVDGIQAASFLRSDATDTATGNVSLRAGGSHLGNHEFASASSSSTGYSDAGIEVREGAYGSSTASAPRISFHWGNVVASNISMDSAGAILIRNNPGTGYENFRANNIYANGTNLVWHVGNDGSGSGLDADLLDGLQTASGPTANTIPTRTSNGDIAAREIILSSALITATPTVLVSMYPGTNQLVRTTPAAVALGMGAWTSSNDGSGSGLDADTVDGVQASQIIYGNSSTGTSEGTFTDWNSINKSGFYSDDAASNKWSTANWSSVLHHKLYSSNNNYATQLGFDTYNNNLYTRTNNSGTWTSWDKIWHAGVDGSGSGLDADLLDGQHGTHYTNAANLTGTLNKDRLPNFVHLGTATTTGYATDDGGWGSRLNVASNVHAKIEVSQEANSMRSHWFAHTGHDSIKFGTSTSHDVEIQRGGITRIEATSTGAIVSGELNVSRNGGVTGSSAPQYGNVNIELETSSNHVPGISFHRSGYSATTLYEYDGQLYTNPWTTRSQTGLLMAQGNLLAGMVSVDGSGSGLDADLLDGIQGSSFFRTARTLTSINTISNGGDRYDPSTNNPTNEHYAVLTYGNGGNVTGQLATHFQTGNLYSRGYNSSWSAWRTNWNSSNDGSGSGLDADLLDGYNASSSGAANTIVLRNSSGHIYGQYILGSYFNASSGNSENPTIGQVWTQSTGDNYLRKSTPAHFKSQLGLFSVLSGGTAASVDSYTDNGVRPITYPGFSKHLLSWNAGGSTGTVQQEFDYTPGRGWRMRTKTDNSSWQSWAYVNLSSSNQGVLTGTTWTSGNDGSGSGLDADLLDGYNSAENGGSIVLRTASNGYLNVYNWIHVSSAGLFTSVNGAHWRPNQAGSYGTWRIDGSRGGYSGIYHANGGGVVSGMYDSGGNGGDYNSTNAWHWYWHRSNACLAVAGSTTSSSYSLYVGGAIYATGNITAYSDRRVKENIIPIDNALEKVNALQGVYYNRIDDEDKTKEIGFIAQEVNEVAPELVTYAEDVDQYGVKYGNTTALLVEAVKELTQQVKDLKQEIEEIKNVK